MIKKLVFVLVLFTLVLVGTIWSDDNGVWIKAEDVQGGSFASDEVNRDFEFVGNVTLNTVSNCNGKLYTDVSGKVICGNDNVNDADSDLNNEIQNLNSVLTQGNDAGGSLITNVAEPVNNADAATKNYVDSKTSISTNLFKSRYYVFEGVVNSNSYQFPRCVCDVSDVDGECNALESLDVRNIGFSLSSWETNDNVGSFCFDVQQTANPNFLYANVKYVVKESKTLISEANRLNVYGRGMLIRNEIGDDDDMTSIVPGAISVFSTFRGDNKLNLYPTGIHFVSPTSTSMNINTYDRAHTTTNPPYNVLNNGDMYSRFWINGMKWSFLDTNGEMFRIDSSGIKYKSASSLSDVRFKENIANLNNSLNKILAIRGVRFNLKQDDSKDVKIGVIAQELENILPEAVDTDVNGYKFVSYSSLAVLAVEAIKEQQKIIEDKQKEIEDLEDRIDLIEEKVNMLENLN